MLHNQQITEWIPLGASGGQLEFKATVKVELQDQQIPPDSKIYVKFFYDYPKKIDVTLKAGAYLNIIPKQSIYGEGDTIQLFNEVDRDISLMSLFRAISHFICGKVYYNYAINQVLLLSAFEAKFFDETIEGFFKSEGYELIDIDDVVPNSLLKTTGDELVDTSKYGIRSTDVNKYPIKY